VESVYRVLTRVKFEVIVVDNGSAAGVGAWLEGERRKRDGLTVLRFGEPLGFPRAVNAGARAAKYEYLVLLNSDSQVTDGWLEGLAEAIESDERMGIVSPVTDKCGPGPQLVKQRPESGVKRPTIEEFRVLYFFCAMIRRQLWEELGGLDEVFAVGNYEDNDFCLRARMAGWRMAVNPNVFIVNEESRTFEENGIDHDEWLYRNEKVFLEKAGGLARRAAGAGGTKRRIEGTSVIVRVPEGGEERLAETLTSLDNQTVAGFETVVSGDWNEGLARAKGELLAYLTAGDVYLPYHLEILQGILAEGDCEAAYTGWGVAVHRGGKTRRAAVTDWEGRLARLERGPWAPLICWMHKRSILPEGGFREDGGWFREWDFTLRLSRAGRVRVAPGITCERNRWAGEGDERAADAERMMSAYPVSGEAAARERGEFLEAVKGGIWEETLLVERHEREQRARRVRRLLSEQSRLQKDAMEIHEARRRLEEASARLVEAPVEPGRMDFVILTSIHWSDLRQRPHHFAEGLARRGYRVFWVDVTLMAAGDFRGRIEPRRIEENLFEVQLPGFGGDIYHFVWNGAVLELMTETMDQLRRANGMGWTVQLVNFPAWTPLAKSLRSRFGWRILYDCLDDQNAFGELFGHPGMASYEAELTRICDGLTTSGRTLQEKKLAERKDAVAIPNAADYARFSCGRARGLLEGFSHPMIGFFGAFADWLDVEWVGEAARRFPEWTFVYIGSDSFAREETRARWREATSAGNVRVFPKADHETLAAYLAEFDICTMPFLELAITRSMHAVKIYEYLAAGKQVAVPALPEMLPFAEAGLVEVYGNWEESFALLERLAREPLTEEKRAARMAFAERNDWSERVERLIEVARGKGGAEEFGGLSGGDGGLGGDEQ
jgi:hypothetical protein